MNTATAPLSPAGPQASAAAPRAAWWTLVREDVRCVLERDPAARNLLEVWTIYPGVQALALYRVAHAWWQSGGRYGPRWLSFVARWLTNVDIHPAARIGRRLFIDHGACVVIGETAEVGDDVTLYHGVTLGGTTWRAGKRHPTLGDGVVVGSGAKILGAIAVGDNARVAANSVVIEPVPAGATVVGIPGRVVSPKRPSPHGFDLNHHLIPDPVGKAMACLLDRVAHLEQQLAQVPRAAQDRATYTLTFPESGPHRLDPGAPTSPGLSAAAQACHGCDDHCAEPTFDQRPLSFVSTEE